jgi:hypothetical protein
MHVYDGVPRRDYEEALRALGSALDEERLEDVLIVEVADGYLVTGLRRAASDPNAAAGSPRRYAHAERTLQDRDLSALAQRGRDRRGTGHVAGRYEEALRLVGRRVNDSKGWSLLVLDEGHAFLLRMRLATAPDMPYHVRTLGTVELDEIRERALGARRASD